MSSSSLISEERRVEIGRAEEREQAIDHHRFFMNHGRLIFENFHAAFKHAAVSSATGGLGQRLIIIFSWENELHIDVTSDGFDEQINLVSGWCAIGIRNSDTLLRQDHLCPRIPLGCEQGKLAFATQRFAESFDPVFFKGGL